MTKLSTYLAFHLALKALHVRPMVAAPKNITPIVVRALEGIYRRGLFMSSFGSAKGSTVSFLGRRLIFEEVDRVSSNREWFEPFFFCTSTLLWDFVPFIRAINRAGRDRYHLDLLTHRETRGESPFYFTTLGSHLAHESDP